MDRLNLRIHDLRHTVGSMAHLAGLSTRGVADLLGHKRLATTERYVHAVDSWRHGNAATAAATILKFAQHQLTDSKTAAR